MQFPDERHNPLDISPEEFRKLGHQLVDQLAGFLGGLPQRSVHPGKDLSEIQAALGGEGLPPTGQAASDIMANLAPLLFEHSTFNGHPRFFGYITSSASPIGALGDFLAAAINPNVGGWSLSPMATEIERQTVRWISELIHFPMGDGLLVSGGNMANLTAFWAARVAKAPWDVRKQGHTGDHPTLRVYASQATHTWIQKASDLSGLGTEAIRWIEVDDQQRMQISALKEQIAADRKAGDLPIMVIGTAGSVSTGAVDPLPQIAELCQKENLWFHVDGAYGAMVAALPEASPEIKALSQADSVALDPHKWLYAPIEAGCTLVRDPQALLKAYNYRPEYYHFEVSEGEQPVNFYEHGPQNSRGFRALKVWLGLKQAGREGYEQLIRDDIQLSKHMARAVKAHPDLEFFTQEMSICTFRYAPAHLKGQEDRLNTLNTELVERLQSEGRAFLSNAVLDEKFLLRACIVNFRTQLADVLAIPDIVVETARELE